MTYLSDYRGTGHTAVDENDPPESVVRRRAEFEAAFGGPEQKSARGNWGDDIGVREYEDGVHNLGGDA